MSRLLRDRHREEQAHRDRIMRRLDVINDPTNAATRFGRRLPGDPLALRGIPVVGYGIGGASPGTRPESAAA